ncbi:hypothetical protein MMC11_003277 [Xylographa trunciseda]|nr:hypothetical protein [Xylographa trunciseda]
MDPKHIEFHIKVPDWISQTTETHLTVYSTSTTLVMSTPRISSLSDHVNVNSPYLDPSREILDQLTMNGRPHPLKSASGSKSLKNNVTQSRVGKRQFSQPTKRQSATKNTTRALQPLHLSNPRLQQRTTPVQSVSSYRRTQSSKIQTTAKSRAQTRSTVPSTNPKDTEDLWSTLRQQKMSGYSRETEASKNRVKVGPASNTSRTASSRTSAVPGETKKARLKDADFRGKVLLPRGVGFPSTGEFSDAFAHFETHQPDNGVAGYREIAHGYHTEVWLSTSEQLVREVVREYQYMQTEQLCEAEFTTYAKETLLRRDPRFPSYEEAREWRTERMIELVAKPTTSPGSRWCPPPVTIQADIAEYDFDVRPDCQYWLSVRSFNPSYTRLFSRYVYVHNDRITCPYFTIEFKKDGTTVELAQNQVAVAATVALYNRSLLKVERLKLTKRRWTGKHTSSLRHYGVILHGPVYTFWCIRLKEQGPREPIFPHDWNWPGCDMIEATPGNLLTAPNVEHFIHWVNEIHRWGLTVYGPSCQKDIQFCIERREKNVRTSLGESYHDLDPDSDIEVDEEDAR